MWGPLDGLVIRNTEGNVDNKINVLVFSKISVRAVFRQEFLIMRIFRVDIPLHRVKMTFCFSRTTSR